MGRARFTGDDFLHAALAIAAEHGPGGVTIWSIANRLKAPTGSFYHRFASRDVLLARLWLQLAGEFRRGIAAALDAGDALRAALHTPVWARAHRDAARVFLIHQRADFVQGEWPEPLRDALKTQMERVQADVANFARLAFDRTGPAALRRAEFLLAEVPAAAVAQHLRRGEPPPAIVDELITITYRAVVSAYPVQ